MKKNKVDFHFNPAASHKRANRKDRVQKGRALYLERLENRELLDASGVVDSAAALEDSQCVNVSVLNVKETAPIDLSSLGGGEEPGANVMPLATTAAKSLTAPSLVVKNVGTNNATVTIDPATDAPAGTKYTIQYSKNASFSAAITLLNQKPGDVKVYGLIPDTTYYFRVKATAAGYPDSAWSAAATSKTESNVLAAPTIKLQADGKNAVVVSIADAEKAPAGTKYTIQYSKNASFSGAQTLSNQNSGNVKISGLSTNTTYFFRVKATAIGYVNSAWSVGSVSTGPDTITLKAPSLTLDYAGSDSVVVQTVPAFGMPVGTKYTIEYSKNASFNPAETSTLANQESGRVTISGLSPNTKYYFRAKATAEGYKDSAWSLTVAAKTAAPVVKTLTAPSVKASATTSDATITIVPASDAPAGVKYTLQYSKSASFSGATTLSNQSAGDVKLSGLSANTTYFFRVKATAAGYDDSAWFDGSVLTGRDAITLKRPSMMLDYAGKDSVVAQIIPAYGMPVGTTYTIEYCKNTSFSPEETTTLPGQNSGRVTISGLAPNTKYYIRAKATADGYKDSAWSTSIVAKTSNYASNMPAATVESVGTNYVELAIAPDEDAVAGTKYTIQYSKSESFTSAITLTNKTAGNVKIYGLLADTTYYFRVKATAPGSDAEWSEVLSAKTDSIFLTAPTVVVDSVSENAATISIAPASDAPAAAKYTIQYSKNDRFCGATTLANKSSGDFDITGLEPGVTYYFRVKASAPGYVNSGWSESVVATTEEKLLPAPAVAVDSVTTNSAVVTIAADPETPDGTKYTLQYSRDASFGVATITLPNRSAGDVKVCGLLSDTTYYFRVKAVKSGYSEAPWTESVAAKTDSIFLATPTLTVEATESGAVLSILPASDAPAGTKYTIQYSKSDRFYGAVTLANKDAGDVVVSKLTPGTTYYFRVKATAPGYVPSDWSASATNSETDVESMAVLDLDAEEELDAFWDVLAVSIAKQS